MLVPRSALGQKLQMGSSVNRLGLTSVHFLLRTARALSGGCWRPDCGRAWTIRLLPILVECGWPPKTEVQHKSKQPARPRPISGSAYRAPATQQPPPVNPCRLLSSTKIIPQMWCAAEMGPAAARPSSSHAAALPPESIPLAPDCPMQCEA